jgi:hypothetical protein
VNSKRSLIVEILTDLFIIVVTSIPAALSVAGILLSNCSGSDKACYRLAWVGGTWGFSVGAILLIGLLVLPGIVFGYTNFRIRSYPDYPRLRDLKLAVWVLLNLLCLAVASISGYFILKGLAAPI